MTHHTTKNFWKCFKSLPLSAQLLAEKNFKLLKTNPFHPSLQLKKIDTVWSARVGLGFRTLAIEEEEGTLHWFWIGTHDEYERLLANM